MNEENEKLYNYIINLAQNADKDNNHRIISLRKVITKNKNYIDKDVFNKLLDSNDLSLDQKKILKKAIDEDSKTYKFITSLNDKINLKNLKILRNEVKRGKTMTKYVKMFERLNEKLNEKNEKMEIICVGGYVLEYFGLKNTLDVDAFYNANSTINKIINEVGEEFGINEVDGELWLNNNVANLNNAPSKEICDLIYEFSNLKVYIAPLLYVLGMKIIAMRTKDNIDIAKIIKKENIDSPEVVYDKLQDLGFYQIELDNVVDAFTAAYGINWLVKYYESEEI